MAYDPSPRTSVTESHQSAGFVRVRGAREHNLKNVSVDIPRNALVVFTGISGSGKSSLAFGTLYAEAQHRYFESVSPYARRLIDQVGVPDVDSIEGLPPAVALQQHRGSPTTRSFVGSVTTLSNSLRLLYSRAGTYPPRQEHLAAEAFSPNTPAGACPRCHGLGRIYDVSEKTLVPDPSLTIRDRAIAAWPPAWHGQNLRDILVSLGYDVDRPWGQLPKKDRDWILFTDDQPVVPVYAGFTPKETRDALRRKEEPSYQGTFSSARRYVLHTFATTHSARLKQRAAQYLESTACPLCHGKRLRRASLSVKFASLDIADMSALPLRGLAALLRPYAERKRDVSGPLSEEKMRAAAQLCGDILARVAILADLGLGYLTLDRSTPTLSPGELQRLRLATQIRSHLFGVIYVLDEPTAGLHPADTVALLSALAQLKQSGNTVFVVEHDLDVIRHADWLVDVGPEAGERGGQILYSGPPSGLREVAASHTRRYMFAPAAQQSRRPRQPVGWLQMRGVSRNNLHGIDVSIPLGVMATVTGVSGSGKSTLVSQVLVELMARQLGTHALPDEQEKDPLLPPPPPTLGGSLAGDTGRIRRMVQVDQKPIGRTPRSNLATYTGLFDHVRRLFAATKAARARRFDAGRFSFNVAKGRCPTCEGEGSVCVELIFLPSVFAPCPTCHGARYNPDTLKVRYRDKNIAEVLRLTVAEAHDFFEGEPAVTRTLQVLRQVGVDYLRLGQPATELSGGEAQRIKLATELQRVEHGETLYILDEPTTGLHAADVEKLVAQLDGLVAAGNSVVLVEHEMQIVANSDWLIDVGPGAGDEGGRIVAQGTPAQVAKIKASRTAPYLARFIA